MAFHRKLTEQQIADVGSSYEQLLAATTAAGPGDRPAAAAAVRAVYRTAGLLEPAVVWTDSPLGGAMAVQLLRRGTRWPAPAPGRPRRFTTDLADQLRQQSAERIREQVSDRYAARFGQPVEMAHWDLQHNAARAELSRRLRGRGRSWELLERRLEELHLLHNLDGWSGGLHRHLSRRIQQLLTDRSMALVEEHWEQLPEPVREQFHRPGSTRRRKQAQRLAADAVTRILDEHFGSFSHCYRVMLHLHAATVSGLQVPWLAAVEQSIRSVGRWWWPLHGVAVLSDRPTVVHRDADRRLHSADGPAVAFGDELALYHWHGQSVPADLVTGDGWSVRRILGASNVAHRRCAIERLGLDRFVTEAELAPVGLDQPDPGNPGRLLRLYDVPTSLRSGLGRIRVLVVQNASPDRDGGRRSFGLPVPADVPDALAAAAFTFGVARAEYATLERAT